jgi:hypothetical protein
MNTKPQLIKTAAGPHNLDYWNHPDSGRYMISNACDSDGEPNGKFLIHDGELGESVGNFASLGDAAAAVKKWIDERGAGLESWAIPRP